MHARTRHFPVGRLYGLSSTSSLQSPGFPNWFHKARASFAGLTSHSVALGGTALRVITHGGNRD
jgi:hypothetical protein